MSELQDMLDTFDLADQFEVVQADAMLVRCLDCGEPITADVVDLHECGTTTHQPAADGTGDDYRLGSRGSL